MNLMELFVKIGVDDQASSKVQQISNTIGKGLSSAASLGMSAVSGTAKMIGNTLATAAKVGAAAIGAVSTAVVKLGKDAIESYADYEQLVGGIETLFKDSADTVEEYANQAYKTAGLSANEYMETVTSFSASLLQSFGDTSVAITEETADAMKDSLDEQVEAFEKATDAKIELINKEYTENLKLIDEEKYARLKAIDEQIDSLNAQTEAEREAREKQEEEQRKAELRSKIANAKNAEERREAEQDLADYILKIEQEAREKERKLQIEALRDQKDLIKEEADARKDALKEQYDEELSTYKKSREEQLEVLKDSVERQKDLITQMIGQTTSSMEKTSEAYRQAAEYANMAVTDMSDNANKMGTDMAMIQNAYQGFAKQNYTMLDNLKLGYGGTKTEMQRLIADANAVKEANGEMADLSIESFADVVEAIHIIQNEMGITGTTALEASKTISGSANAMKASWKNLLTAIASNNKDIKKNVKEFTESVGTFADNLLPRIDAALDGLGMLVTELEPTLDGALGMAMDKLFTALPQMVNIGSNLVSTLVNGINSNKDKLGEAAKTTVSAISQFVFNEAPQLLKTGGDLILELVKGLEIKDMSEQAGKVIADMVLYLTDPNVVDTIIDAGFDLLEGLISGFTSGENVERLVGNITNLVTSLSDKITDNKEEIVSGAVSLLERFGKALDENNTISAIVNGVFSVVGGVISELIKPDNLKRIFNVAADLLDELADGIFGFTRNATTTIPDVIDALVETLTDKEATGALLDAGGRLAGAFLYGFHIWVSDGIASFMNLLADDFATLFGEDNALTQGLRDFADFNSNVRYNTEIAALYGMDEKLREEQREVRENAPTLNQWQGVGKSENAEKLEMTQEMYDKLPYELKQNPNIVIIQNFNSEAKSAADMQDEAMYAAKNAILNGN